MAVYKSVGRTEGVMPLFCLILLILGASHIWLFYSVNWIKFNMSEILGVDIITIFFEKTISKESNEKEIGPRTLLPFHPLEIVNFAMY